METVIGIAALIGTVWSLMTLGVIRTQRAVIPTGAAVADVTQTHIKHVQFNVIYSVFDHREGRRGHHVRSDAGRHERHAELVRTDQRTQRVGGGGRHTRCVTAFCLPSHV